MPTTNLLLTDAELLKALEQSALSENEKKEFESLMKTMNEAEKQELQQLIDEANQAKTNFEKERAQQLVALNQATEDELKNLERRELKDIRQKFEQFDQQENEKELTDVEATLQNNHNANSSDISSSSEIHQATPSPHRVRNFLIGIISLVLLGLALIFALSTF